MFIASSISSTNDTLSCPLLLVLNGLLSVILPIYLLRFVLLTCPYHNNFLVWISVVHLSLLPFGVWYHRSVHFYKTATSSLKLYLYCIELVLYFLLITQFSIPYVTTLLFLCYFIFWFCCFFFCSILQYSSQLFDTDPRYLNPFQLLKFMRSLYFKSVIHY